MPAITEEQDRGRVSAPLVPRGEGQAWAIVLGGALAVAGLAIALGDEPAEQFGEGGLGTWASVVLLAASAVVAFATWRARRAATGAALVWLVIAAGFVYLALDDALSWHEKLDRFVHRKVLGIATTEVTKHLDDLILGVYGLLALAVLYRFRDELRRVPGLPRVLALAMGLMFLQVAIDMLDHPDAIRALVDKGPVRQLVRLWTPVVEETVKLLAEGVFLLGFLRARRYAG